MCVTLMRKEVIILGIKLVKEGYRAVEMKAKNLKNGKDEVRGKMIKSRGELMIHWVWKSCNMALEVGVWVATCINNNGEIVALTGNKYIF